MLLQFWEVSKCKCLSVLHLKDAYHEIKLSGSSKAFCGILPYIGSASYVYQRMPMKLRASPVIWQSYTNAIYISIPEISKYLAITNYSLLHSCMVS